MSWDGYVQALIDRKLVHGAIYGPPRDGSGAWFVASDGSNVRNPLDTTKWACH